MLLDISSPAFRVNPYPQLKQFRRSIPICQTQPHPCWAVLRYEDVRWVLKQDALFSSVLQTPTHDEQDARFLLYARSLVGMDNPEHQQLRQRLSHAFSRTLINQLDQYIESICQHLVLQLPLKQPIDFADTFSKPLPILVLLRLLGIDGDHVVDIKKWVVWLLSWRNHKQPKLMMADIEKMHQLLNDAIACKRQQPGEDLLSSLLATSETDLSLTNRDILALVRLLLTAGTDTATSLLNHAIMALAEEPELFATIKADKTLIDKLIDETLRYNSPTICLIRRATRDIQMGDKIIREGEIVLPFLASANHDETVFANPERFNIHRPVNPHFGFGTGIHHCLGYHLGRLQVRKALSVICDRFSSISMPNNKPMRYLPTLIFRSLCDLPAIFT